MDEGSQTQRSAYEFVYVISWIRQSRRHNDRLSAAGRWGPEEGINCREAGGTFGVMKIFCVLTVMVVT